ncbi:MAG: acetate/propionate family kinase [Thermoleophilia bacterium]
MNTLIINCGSSSLGFGVFAAEADGGRKVVAAGKAKNVATATQAASVVDWTIGGQSGQQPATMETHRAAAHEVLAILSAHGVAIDAVGHRFVHGGDRFTETTRIDDEALAELRATLPLAPIHNPNSFSVIEVCLERLPGVAQYAVFDTAFHAAMPPAAREYAIPRELARDHSLRKYGFHGLSYQYVSARTAELLGKPVDQVRLIMCHLGTGGSSVCAFAEGRSQDTSMGYSPLQGLVMSTRSGDIDAEVVLALIRAGYTPDEVGTLLNSKSGLIGVSGYSSNLAEVIAAAADGNDACALAYEVYAHRLRHYIGAYLFLLGGADALVFTDDIGVKSWELREKVCAGAEGLGLVLDPSENRQATSGDAFVEASTSTTRIMVVKTDEERVIFDEVRRQLAV